MRIAINSQALSKLLMRFLVLGAVWVLLTSVLFAQSEARVRPMIAAGSYYPADSASLNTMLKGLFARAEVLKTHDEVLGVLAPHAGYAYSGVVAASAVNQVDAFRSYETIFLLGTSHHETYPGASVYIGKAYQTPLGQVPVNTQVVDTLLAGSSLFQFRQQAHDKEHSLEVLLPFLQHKLKQPFSIVPILVGARDLRDLQKIAEVLQPHLTSGNLFILSTDFSHYPAYDAAVKVDTHVGEAVATGKVHALLNALNETGSMGIENLHTSMCGWPSTITFLYMLQQLPQAKVVTVEYRNSGDALGDKSRVVGYHAMAFVKKREKSMNNQGSFRLTDQEKSELLALARRTLKNYLSTGRYDKGGGEDVSPALKQEGGAFVTLHNKGALRGCIGRFPGSSPLYQVVQEMAIAAATKDSRFPPLEPQELEDIHIEISVLTPMERITDPSEIELGRHGIYIRKGLASGTFLPQVASETGWTKEEFLGHCAKDKAGIGWDGWKQADLFRYEAFVFSE